jgi:gliding motility-associated-like protein
MSLDAGAGFASYAWTNGATSQTVSVGPGIYNVAVVDSNGCSGSSNIVYLTSFPALATPTVSGNATLLTASTAPNYQWYYNGAPISGANSGTYVPTLSGNYAVGVTDPYNCADAMSATIEVILDITADDIPQGFSPNGDGINDRFEIQNINQFLGNSLVVMNRWGQKVFSQAPYSNSFNGKGLGGEDLPDGTYFYILDLGTGKVFNDYLIINR